MGVANASEQERMPEIRKRGYWYEFNISPKWSRPEKNRNPINPVAIEILRNKINRLRQACGVIDGSFLILVAPHSVIVG